VSSLSRKFYLTLTTVVLFIFALASIFIYLLQFQILPLARDFFSVIETIKIAESKVSYFKNVVAEDMRDAEHDIQSVNDHFFIFTQRTSKEFIIFQENAAKRNNLSLNISSLEAGVPPSTSVLVRGSFADVMKYIMEMENESILIKVEGLTIRDDGDAVSATIQMSLAKK
jgi:hypothetical protein